MNAFFLLFFLMARPIRIEFSGAVYHVTARGNRGEPIYEDDTDRKQFLEIFGQVITEYNWLCHAYCLMTNHYHVVIETPDGNLSKGMRQLNGIFTQTVNRRHQRTGHVFQGRYKAIVIDVATYLLELTRYVVLNPVRAGMVEHPGAWPWSSYTAMTGEVRLPSWLSTDWLLSQFATRRTDAVRTYVQFVAQGRSQTSIWDNLNRQVFLGDDEFIVQTQKQIKGLSQDVNIPQAQRRPPAPSLATIAQSHDTRNQAIMAAYATGDYSYQQLAEFFRLHFTTVGKIVRAGGKNNKK